MKQIESLKALKPEENKKPESNEGIFPKDTRIDEIKNEIYEIKKWKEKIKQEGLKYKTKNYMFFKNVICYQQNSRVLYTFFLNKLFGELLDIFP